MWTFLIVGNDASLAYSDRNKLISGNLYGPLMKYLETVPGPKLLVIDTLADTFAGNENDRAAVNAFIKQVLGSMIVKRECTVVLIGHPAKSNESQYSGSTAWNNAARTRLTLESHPNPYLTDYRMLTRSKSNYAKIGEQIELYYNSGVYEPVQSGEIVDTVTEKNKEIIFDEIAKQADTGKPYGMFNASVPNILNFEFTGSNGKKISKQEVKSLIDLLSREGRVRIVKGDKRGGNGLFPVNGCAVNRAVDEIAL